MGFYVMRVWRDNGDELGDRERGIIQIWESVEIERGVKASVRNTIIGECSFKNSSGILNKKVKGIGFQGLVWVRCGMGSQG